MSKKQLVEQALSDKKVDEDNNPYSKIKGSVSLTLPHRQYVGFSHNRRIESVDYVINPVSYPPNMTDQTHALTLAEQVRRGQGDAEKPDPDAYDFPDGKDDGSDAHGIFEFSERVDQWIAEQNLSDELRQSFRDQVLSREIDKAQSKIMQQNDSLKDSLNVSEVSKSSETSNTSS